MIVEAFSLKKVIRCGGYPAVVVSIELPCLSEVGDEAKLVFDRFYSDVSERYLLLAEKVARTRLADGSLSAPARLSVSFSETPLPKRGKLARRARRHKNAILISRNASLIDKVCSLSSGHEDLFDPDLGVFLA